MRIMKNKLIENVPAIPYDGNNAGMFTTILQCALQSMGDECDAAKLTALSGAGNRFCWKDGEWRGGCEVLAAINETPYETELRVLTQISWLTTYVNVVRDTSGTPLHTNHEAIRRDFVQSIDRGHPVIAYLVKRPDCTLNLFFGYEDDGEKIVSYNYSDGSNGAQLNLTDDNRKPVAEGNWESNIEGYIILKSKAETTSERDTALMAFEWISYHARRTTELAHNQHLVGFAAWESYLRLLEHDDFASVPLETVQRRFGIYCDGLCQIWERNQALPYYRALSKQFPEWSERLDTAVAALEECANYGGFLWKRGFTFDKNGFEKFRDPAERKILADEGRRAMQKDIEAVEQFEMILKSEVQNR